MSGLQASVEADSDEGGPVERLAQARAATADEALSAVAAMGASPVRPATHLCSIQPSSGISMRIAMAVTFALEGTRCSAAPERFNVR
jgi:hypothetical protein